MGMKLQLKPSAIFARSSVNWILFLLLSLSLNLTAQQKKILWIGNSYIGTNNLPLVFYNLSISGGDTVQYDSNTPGGATLQNHATSTVTQQKISSQPWDFVVVQAQSQEPSFPPNQVQTQTLPFATDLDSMIRANNSCSETVFYMTWGRKYGDQTNCPNYPPLCTFEGMNNRLRSSYKLMADQNQGIVAPVGPAWKNSWFADSTINLWVSDNSHPSPSGTYLTACVFYSTFFRKSPVGFPYTAGLSQEVAAYLQEVAWNTVNDSLETWNIGRWDPQAGFNYSIDEASVDFNQTSLYGSSNIWNFGDGNTSPLVNPTHTYSAPGNYNVSLIVNGCGRSDTLVEPISITATSVAENVKDIDWRIFPNPSTRDVMIQAEDVTTFKIEVYGPDGKLAKRKIETGRLIKLDFSDLPSGIYQVYCYGNGSSRIFRLMKE
jgi:hypothetical protein